MAFRTLVLCALLIPAAGFACEDHKHDAKKKAEVKTEAQKPQRETASVQPAEFDAQRLLKDMAHHPHGFDPR